MASMKINYLSRAFDAIKDDLIRKSKEYYPELAESYTDESIGSWFIDLVSAVGDDLSYHTDRMAQEMNLDDATKRSTVMNIARSNGLKVPGMKASMCEVLVSCELPLPNGADISQPNYDYAPIVQIGTLFRAGNEVYELAEDINFAEQFNSNGYSNRTITPSTDSNGNITAYTVTKRAIAVNGTTKVYKKVIYANDLQPFMEIVLPESNVMNVESIIFKDTSNYTLTPMVQEYYIDEEEYTMSNEAVKTYRFFECDSLADMYRFGTESKMDEGVVADIYDPEVYVDYTENGNAVTRYYRGKWKPLKQKFITEFTDNGFMKIIFGSGNGYGDVPSAYSNFAQYQASKLINNDMLGVLPKEGWTMFVLYRVGGGSFTNLGPGAINDITQARVDWKAPNLDGNAKGKVLTSLKVTNTSSGVGGKDAPSIDELKMLIKYNTSAQNRAVVVNDYKIKLMQMPPKYGAPFRCSVAEANNKIEMSYLGLDNNGKLDSALPQTLVENMLEYMSHYKQINDYIEMRSGKIYNLGIALDVFIDKNYNMADVLSNISDTIQEFFDVRNREMGVELFIGELQKTINSLDGVISIIELRVYALSGDVYSPDECPLPKYTENDTCNVSDRYQFQTSSGAKVEEIDLSAIDGVLTLDYNAMFEILHPSSDIQIRPKLR